MRSFLQVTLALHAYFAEAEVIDLLENILTSPLANHVTREFIMTALVKLTTRFTSGQECVARTLTHYCAYFDIDLRVHAVYVYVINLTISRVALQTLFQPHPQHHRLLHDQH
jgi:hypothetical protein